MKLITRHNKAAVWNYKVKIERYHPCYKKLPC